MPLTTLSHINNRNDDTLFIYGHGGFAKEVEQYAYDIGYTSVYFITEHSLLDENTIVQSEFDPSFKDVFIAIGNPSIRRSIVDNMGDVPCNFVSIVHPTAYVRTNDIGMGAIVSPNCVVTTNVHIGNFSQIHYTSTVGHDSYISDFVTISPTVSVSGNVSIYSGVYIGTHASIRERVTVFNNITVGMGATVVTNLTTPGTYVGSPAKLLTKSN